MEGDVGAEKEARDGLADLVNLLHRQHQHANKSLEAPVALVTPSTGDPPAASSYESSKQSVDDVLELVVHDVLNLIPAERSVLFVYDKSANSLKPQFIASQSKNAGSDAAATSPPATQDGATNSTLSGDTSHAMLGFPPVMGMISACFLHKRCLRMQEPRPHRTFHRDYDAPKDMSVDSILCAPIILHHRVIGVIQLVNRIDRDGLVFGDDQASSSFDSHTKPIRPHQSTHRHGDDREIKLRRLKTVKAHARIGFSSKDEQKLIQFASHVAQVVESKFKHAAGSGTETQAALREEHAKSALELLSMLSEKLDYQSSSGARALTSTPMPIRKKASVEHEPPVLDFKMPEDPPAPPPTSPMFVPEIDSLLVAMAIVKVQGMFRGRRVRRAEKFAEALEKFRLQKQRLRSAILIQRLARGSLVRKRHRAQRQAAHLLSRAYNKFKFRSKIEVHLARKRTERQLMIARKAMTTVKAKPQFSKRLGVVGQDVEKFRGGVKSVSALQKRFRDKQSQKAAEREASTALRKIIKLQSFLRGSLVRKQVKELVTRAAQTPTVVCLRIASTSSPNQVCDHCDRNQQSPRDRRDKCTCCVYAMPERVTKAAHLSCKRGFATRHRLEESFDHARNQVVVGEKRISQVWDRVSTKPRSQRPPQHDRQPISSSSAAESNGDHYTFGVELRRLAPSNSSRMVEASCQTLRVDMDATGSSADIPTHRLSQAFPVFAFDSTRKKGKQSSPGVEYASELSPRHRNPHAPMNAQRPSTQQHQPPRHLEASESNSFRRQAFFATVEMTSRSELRDSSWSLPPNLPRLRGLSHQKRQLQIAESVHDRSLDPNAHFLLCCLLPAADANKSTPRIHRSSRLSLSQSPSPNSPKRPSTTNAVVVVSSSSSDAAASPSAFATPHRKLTVPGVTSFSVAP